MLQAMNGIGERRFQVTRGGLVAGLLVLAFLTAVVLAIQAYGAARYHRVQAERVLRDYARLAAARFAQRTSQNFYYHVFAPGLEVLYRKAGRRAAPLPPPAKLAALLDEYGAPVVARARYTLRLDLSTGVLTTAGGTPSPAVRRWLTDTLPAHSRASYSTEEKVAAVMDTVGGEPRAVAYTVLTNDAGKPQTLLGFEIDPRTLAPFYNLMAEKFPLLPRPLTGGVIYDSVGSVIVTFHNGAELYRSPVQYERTFVARDSLEAGFGALQVEVALRPEMAAKLVIGGLPSSRLPLILGLLGVTAVLIGTALVQLRREYELARLRTDFISGVSHELRTPLAQIRMFSETLVLGRVRSEDEQVRSLAIIDQEARRLTHLVENLLHFSRSERRAARVAPEPTAVAPLVQEVIEGFAPLAAVHGVSLRAEVPEGLVAPVDPGAARQMLLNLLDNAVKYGPPGQTVTVGADRGDGTNGVARLWVDDCGPGVPSPDRERVWERFWRLERDRGTVVAGSGIGLAVVRELATLHHGRTWVEDAASGGSRFVIELPVA
jgi:signal transduction histidine kinase